MADSPEWWTRAAEAASVFLAGLFGVRQGRKHGHGTYLNLERRVSDLEEQVDGNSKTLAAQATTLAVMASEYKHISDALERIEGRLDRMPSTERRARPREDQ